MAASSHSSAAPSQLVPAVAARGAVPGWEAFDRKLSAIDYN